MPILHQDGLLYKLKSFQKCPMYTYIRNFAGRLVVPIEKQWNEIMVATYGIQIYGVWYCLLQQPLSIDPNTVTLSYYTLDPYILLIWL